MKEVMAIDLSGRSVVKMGVDVGIIGVHVGKIECDVGIIAIHVGISGTLENPRGVPREKSLSAKCKRDFISEIC